MDKVPSEPPPPYEELESVNLPAEKQGQSTIGTPGQPDSKELETSREIESGDDDHASSSYSSETLEPDIPSQPLPLPVVVPQTTKSYKGAFFSPFVRAYVREFDNHGIDEASFLSVIDGLNECWVPHPVYQGLQIVGRVLGFVYGSQTVQLAGLGLEVAAGAASAATSYARTRAYVKAINTDLFRPSGLVMRVMPTKKMMEAVGCDGTKLNLPPLEDEQEIDQNAFAEPITESTPFESKLNFEDPRMRRIRALEGYVMQLSLDVPPNESPPDNLLKRMGDNQAKRLSSRQEKRMRKRQSKIEKREERHFNAGKRLNAHREAMENELELRNSRQEARLEAVRSGSSAGAGPSLSRKEERKESKEEAKHMRKMEKRLEKREKKVQKAERKLAKKKNKHDKKETKVANKIRWLVVSRIDKDAEDDSEDDLSGSEGEVESNSKWYQKLVPKS